MHEFNIKFRTDACVGFAEELVQVPGVVLAGVFDAVPQPDRVYTRA